MTFWPRAYTVVAAATAETAAFDVWELIAGTTKGLILLGIDIGQQTEVGDAQDEQITYLIKRFAGTYTSGSGGNTGVARPPTDSTAAAATFTAETMNTTQASAGTGTLTTLYQSTYNVRAGLYIAYTPEMAPRCAGAEGFVISLAAPADSVTFTGTITVGEVP